MLIGWALPSSCPSSRVVTVGDGERSWAVDGLRAMKWHGNTSPVSSPHAHGVPYGKSWKWGAGDVIGCAVDVGAGTMSFRYDVSDRYRPVLYCGCFLFRETRDEVRAAQGGLAKFSRVKPFGKKRLEFYVGCLENNGTSPDKVANPAGKSIILHEYHNPDLLLV